MFEFELKTKVKDLITGYTGIVTGRLEYISGSRRYLVETITGTGNTAENWFDESRLEVV